MTYVLVIVLGSGAFALATYTGETAFGRCLQDGRRITDRDIAERKRQEDPTYRGFIRAVCERIDR